jgi:hypothetical protein
MDNQFATLGYGFHLEETRIMLGCALNEISQQSIRDYCIQHWPQKSVPNKVRMWTHLSKRYLDFKAGKILRTPFLKLYGKIYTSERDDLDLIFLQLCGKTAIIFETLRSLVTDSFLNTGEAVFSKYHLDQLLEKIFGHVPQSTCERVRQILIRAGRLRMTDSNYTAKAYCPSESVLGYALYQDGERYGWRAPSTTTIMEQGTIAPAFLCNRSLLIVGVTRLASEGHCEYHRHGHTDQVQLTHRSLEEFVDAWK